MAPTGERRTRFDVVMLVLLSCAGLGSTSTVVASGSSACTLANITGVLAPGSWALRQYVSSVYGHQSLGSEANERDERFAHRLAHEVEVIWLAYLPPPFVERCTWPTELPAHGSPDGQLYMPGIHYLQPAYTVFVYRRRTTCRAEVRRRYGNQTATPRVLSFGLPVSGAPDMTIAPLSHASAAGLVNDDGAVEVLHMVYGHTLETMGMWMYRAPGSGLWYKPRGEVASAYEHASLFAYFHYMHDTWEVAEKELAKRRLALLHALGAKNVSTVTFSNHCETSVDGVCAPFVRELVHVGAVSPCKEGTFRWGAAAEHRCTCALSAPGGSSGRGVLMQADGVAATIIGAAHAVRVQHVQSTKARRRAQLHGLPLLGCAGRAPALTVARGMLKWHAREGTLPGKLLGSILPPQAQQRNGSVLSADPGSWLWHRKAC